ncbi:MAG: hypothetical protein PQJ60_11090, partial [Spirochaetales bacterium]|nr:hypothetical protein [Spirochaetales bacterium]
MIEKDMVDHLNHVVKELGDIYLGMSDTYPRFFDQLDREFLCFKEEEEDKHVLSAVSNHVFHFNEKKESFSRDNREKEKELIETVGRELKKLSHIEEGIVGMEECSEDLELISLNAMVSALKAGNNGGAFPYITRELQRVSRQSRETSNTIRKNGLNLDREYKDLVDRIQQGQKDTGKDIGLVYESLETVITRLTFYDDAFREQCEILEDGVQRMRAPLHMILEEVQKHDIVRQSVDHIILSLNEIRDSGTSQTVEEKLNHLKFASQAYELSRFIIEDIKESVCRSFDRFTVEKRDVEKILASLNREMEEKGREIRRDDIGSRIDSIRRSLTLYFSTQDDSLSNRKMSAEHFNELIDDLEGGIEQYIKVLSAIRNIHVASRIEVVKLKKLENMENIINNIDHTVGMMESQLGRIGDAVGEFRKASGTIVSDFIGYFSHVKDQIQ